VPAEAAEVRDFDSLIPPSPPVRADQRVIPTGGSQCSGFSTAPAAQSKTGLGWGYESREFQSGLAHPVCVTVDLTPSPTCPGISSASYAGSFVPSNALAFYLGHGATDAGYSYAVGADSTVTIVVMAASEGTGCGSHVTITSKGPWADANQRPTIAGVPAVSSTLSGTGATWKGNPSPTTEQQRWVRCDATGADCTDIPGATQAGYTVRDADLGHTLRFRNIATDPDGTSMSDSNFVEAFIPFEEHANQSLTAGDRVQNGKFTAGAPDSHCGVPKLAPFIANPTSPFLFDAYPVGSLLNDPVCLVARTQPGCASGVSPNIYNPAFAPATGTDANYAANATTSGNAPGLASAVLPPAGTAEVVVNHVSPTGSCAQYAVTLGADAPFASARPTVAGTPVEGGTLTAGNGTWSGSPAFSHAWLRCDATGAACSPIDGATGASYSPTTADVGSRLRARVTAAQGRSVSSDSEPTGIVAAAPTQPGGLGGGEGGGTSQPPVDRTGPKATLTLKRTTLQKVLKSGVVPITATCDEACTITLRADVTRKLGKRLGGVKIASGKGTLRAGRKTTVKVKLARKARKALRRSRSVGFTLKATATDAAGNRSDVAKKLTLKAKR
jgi:hypothetical protein